MDKYAFIENQITRHPELPQWTKEELQEREIDFEFWNELIEHIDCIRICEICNRPMIEGYCIDDGREHYCSDECLHHRYRNEEFETMYDNGNGNSYWTVWWE